MHRIFQTVFHAQNFLQTDAFAHRRFYTQTLLHTLAQKYLIELLLWSASGVHKQSPKVWQEKLDDLARKPV